MGHKDDSGGIQTRIYRAPADITHKNHRTPSKHRAEIRASWGSGKASTEEIYLPDLSPICKRVLVDLLLNNKEVRGLETHPELETFKPVHQAKEVQDGVVINSSQVSHQGLLGDVDRPKGCLPPRSDTSRPSEVATVHDKGSGLLLQEPSIWTVNGPKGVYQNSQGSGSPPTTVRGTDLHVPGRLVDIGSLTIGGVQKHPSGGRRNNEAGVYHQPGQVTVYTQSEPSLLGCSPESGPGISVSVAGSYRQPDPRGFVVDSEECGSGITMAKGVRNDGECSRLGTFLPTQNENHPITLPEKIQTGCSSSETLSSCIVRDSPGARMVDDRGESPERGDFPNPSTPDDGDHRCVSDRLGRVHSRTHSTGNVDTGRVPLPHQCTGTVGCEEFSSSTRTRNPGQAHTYQNRQYNSGMLHKQAGRNEINGTLSPNEIVDSVVRGSRHPIVCSPHPGGSEHVSRQSIQGSVDEIGRVVSLENNLSETISGPRLPNNRSIRDSNKPPTPCVLLLGKGPGGMGRERLLNPMERDSRLCFPTTGHCSPGPSEDSRGRLPDSSDSTHVAQTNLVSDATATGSRLSDKSPDGCRPTTNDGVESTLPPGTKSSFDCLDLIKQRYQKAGLSEESATMVARGRRKSTLRVYSSRVKPYIEWCKHLQISPDTASIANIADFLRSRFDKGLQATTVCGYLKAIQSFHRGAENGEVIKNNQTLHFLIEGMANVRPKKRNIWPSWDLPLVLSKLSKNPYEPVQAAAPRDVALKTAFLIALASGRRCSEIQALSIGRFMVFSKAGVTLHFRPNFLAKNERSDFSAKPIFLPYIDQSTDRAQRLNCPVRALKWYVDKTQIMRGDIEQLFITSRKPYHAVARATISGWLVDVIKSAKAVLEVGNPKAHSVRAYSTSWAHAKGISVSDIMNTVSWRSENTFTQVYMKDVRLRSVQARYANQVLSSSQPISTRSNRGTSTPSTRQGQTEPRIEN